ncbi:Pth11-like integral membrane [Emericellopsis cladophorae]|uniref:Pth11-like integral membrane n=1 Tax=Emericellopsis cladophorae TaxID=2686198 RepID=A0A9P9XUC4_9HYPO|nr:Pth11-like integral membrane [Emericellopsis cladophorae]KAI6777743.1 Pth11-like integral membrane [Emericellopsis cladophorae]
MSEPDQQLPPPPPDPSAPLQGAARTIDREGLLAIIWVCFSVATIFVGVRLSVRWRQNRTFLPDDCWVIFAWLCILTMAILQTQQMNALWYTTYLIAGRLDFTDVEGISQMQIELKRWQFPIIKLFWTTLWAIKASFLALFYRVIRPLPVLRRLCALTCTPPGQYFKAGGCDSDRDVWMQRFNVLYSTSVDIASDLMIMALPIMVLPSLQLDKRKKIGLGIAFSLGFIIIAVAIVRMSQVIVGDQVDLVGLAIWGAVETATAVIVGSLPALKGVLARSIKNYQTTRRTGGKYATGSGSMPINGYAQGSRGRTVHITNSIPLDDVHESSHVDGGIFVRKTYEQHVEQKALS